MALIKLKNKNLEAKLDKAIRIGWKVVTLAQIAQALTKDGIAISKIIKRRKRKNLKTKAGDIYVVNN